MILGVKRSEYIMAGLHLHELHSWPDRSAVVATITGVENVVLKIHPYTKDLHPASCYAHGPRCYEPAHVTVVQRKISLRFPEYVLSPKDFPLPSTFP